MTKLALEHGGGFGIAVLAQKENGVALEHKALPVFEKVEIRRLLIISNNEITKLLPVIDKNIEIGPKKKFTRTNNRKRPIFDDMFIHNNVWYRINNGKGEKKYGLYLESLHSIAEQLQVGLSKWRRVFVLRSELHMPYKTDNSEQVTKFIKRLSQKLKREYGFKEIGYCWAREYHGKGKGQHYHFALLLDGNLIRHSSRINEIIRKAWQYPTDDYTIGKVERPYYFVDGEEVAQKAMYRLSYLAKTRGKGHRPPQAKDFQCSRMKV